MFALLIGFPFVVALLMLEVLVSFILAVAHGFFFIAITVFVTAQSLIPDPSSFRVIIQRFSRSIEWLRKDE